MLYGFFLFSFLTLFEFVISDYPTCKSKFRVSQTKINVYCICSKLKMLAKLISVTAMTDHV